MFEIYCAFNPVVNKAALEFGQGHVVKIGHTNSASTTSRIDVLRAGWPPGVPTDKKRSMPLAADPNWDFVGRWPVKYDRSEAKKLEVRVRRWFRTRCGETGLIERLRPIVLDGHVELNGLTELVCVDLTKIGATPYISPPSAWAYPETPDLIRKVIETVRKFDADWRREALKNDSQTV
jgi:hypothetical protein